MLDLTKDKSINFPDYIVVGGRKYKIKTDFKYGMMFSKQIENKSALQDFIPFFEDIYNLPMDMQKAVEELQHFYFPEEPLPNKEELEYDSDTDSKSFDYIIDSSRIYAAFMQVYKIDLFDTQMHWYKFLALFHNLTGTRMNEIMGYRGYNPNDKTSLEESHKKQKRLWSIPEEPTAEELESIQNFNERFD